MPLSICVCLSIRSSFTSVCFHFPFLLSPFLTFSSFPRFFLPFRSSSPFLCFLLHFFPFLDSSSFLSFPLPSFPLFVLSLNPFLSFHFLTPFRASLIYLYYISYLPPCFLPSFFPSLKIIFPLSLNPFI